MATINKKSTILIAITICLVVLLSSGGIYTIIITNTLKPDAEIINKLGVIRGSIQRFVKLELSQRDNDELVNMIDEHISTFNENALPKNHQNENFIDSLNSVSLAWTQIKELRDAYKENPSIENRNSFIDKSEELWEKTNDTVFISQLVSERKVEKFHISFKLFILNLIIGFIIIILLKTYVKDTLEDQVNHDTLTKIYNRRFFNQYLKREILRSERYNRNLSFIMFDIDHFKNVNDTYGHDIGDSVLKELSQLVKNNIRKCDVLSRLGGEEFGVLAPEIDANEAYDLSEKLRTIVENHRFKHVDKITISLGITEFIHGDSIDTIYKRADNALYSAKNNGRNRSEIETFTIYA